jgi:hypothetical protein
VHQAFRKRLLASLVGLALSLAQPLPAAASALTDALDGEWSGSGSLSLTNGKTERIRCRADINASNTAVNEYFNCASTAKNFSFTISLFITGNNVSGDWRGPDRSGTASGRATQSGLQLRLTSTRGNGRLTASISRCSQSIEVTGWSDELRSLSINLEKAC